MIILISYHNEQFLAKVTADHKVMLLGTEQEEKVMLLGTEQEEYIDLKLDQCKECGIWVSEDEELYGDGYCTNCAEMCQDCEIYHSVNDMIFIDDEWVCKKCHEESNKETKE